MHKHTRTALVILFALILAAPSAASAPRQHQTTDRWECSEIDDYRQAVYEAMPTDNRAMMKVFDAEDVTTLRPSVLRDAAEQFDEWAGNLEDMPSREIPKAMREYHDAFTINMGLLAIVLTAMSQGNMFGILPYVDTIEQARIDLDNASYSASVRCPNDWEYESSEPEPTSKEL